MKGFGGKTFPAPAAWKGSGGKAGGKGGKQAGKGMQQRQPAPPPRLTEKELTDRLHKVIHDAMAEAAAPIAHLAGEWGEAEIIRRVSRYMYKAACSPTVMNAPWDKMCQDIVSQMMQSYSGCNESDWFFSIDLPPVFFAAVWEILMATGQARVSSEVVYEAIVIEYEDKLDRVLLDRAMLEAAKGTFGDVLDEKVVGKIFRALSGSYWPSLDACLEERITQESHGLLAPDQELQHVENFFRKWMDASMSRCWGAVPDVETTLTAETTEMLFRTLIAPFGKEDPFSCIPPELTSTIGRPPTDWAFISEALNELFSRWGGGGGSAKKRRKTAAAEEGEDFAQPAVVRRAPPKAAAKVAAKRFAGVVADEHMEEAKEDDGHPRCTSEADCIGSEAEPLVQHILNGEAGDLYCQACWDSFVRRNSQLEGVLVED